MVDELVFHLGDCKTGSTSIQFALSKKLVSSPAADICYETRMNHIPLAKTLTQPNGKSLRDKRFSHLRTVLEQSDARFGVVSAEHFEFVDPVRLKAALDAHLPEYDDRMRLIAYVRPHASRLLSAFSERTKRGTNTSSLEDFAEEFSKRPLLYYAPRFEKWRSVFGDRFSVRLFQRDRLTEGDVVRDFLGFVFGETPYELGDVRTQNESLSVQDIAMMRELAMHSSGLGLNTSEELKSFGWFVAEFLANEPHPQAERPRLHRALAERVAEYYREDAAQMDREFFDGTPLSDALDASIGKAAEAPQSFDASDHFRPEEMRNIRVWASLLSRIVSSDTAHFNWAVRRPDVRDPHPPRYKAK